MRYVSIDLETTGLDPSYCQILEVGMVEDDLEHPEISVSELRTFHCYVTHDKIVGEPFALALNHEIIRRISKSQAPYKYVDAGKLLSEMCVWFRSLGYDTRTKITVAGKNFANFDALFLAKLFGSWRWDCLHQRVLDPCSMYARADDSVPPNLQECCDRAGIAETVSHTAVDDARLVVELVRRGIRRT